MSVSDAPMTGALVGAPGPAPVGTLELLSPFAVHVPTATVAVSTGIRNSAVCSDVDDAIAPITTGPMTKPAQPKPATEATALPVWTLSTAPAALRVIGTTHPSP